MTELLNCTGLSKAYGKKRALDHVDLHLEPGKIICWRPSDCSRMTNWSKPDVNNRQNKQTNIQTFKTTGFGAMQGAMSLGYDTLKVFAGTSGFQVGSCIIGGVDYLNDFAFGLLDAGTM